MNKKRILIKVSCILVLIVGIFIYLYVSKDNGKEIYIPKKEEVKTQISGFNGLSLMYETGPGTGEYQESKSSTWPEEGYIFNENLSACENGGKLSWNEEKKAVILNSFGSDACYVYFDAYILPVINSVSTSNITNDSITLTVNATNGNNPITTYYYSSNNGSNYIESTSNTYTFNNLEIGTEYNFSVYIKDSLGYESEPYTLSETTDDTVLLADWVIEQYGGVQGNNGIYHHQNLANSAEDGSYRYAGANPNNYVCFGDDCSNEVNLYRIIGVFGSEVKLIKSTNYGGIVAWDSGNSNTWNSSTKPDIRSTLNTTFLSTLSATWQNRIATHAFKVGGMANSQTNTAKQYYNTEVGSSSSSTTDSMKIGLMYVSDFGFAASPDYWTTELFNYEPAKSSNWLAGLDEWTISRSSDDSDLAFLVDSRGYVDGFNLVLGSTAVRPSFYLTSSTSYVSGSGSSADPIRIQ